MLLRGVLDAVNKPNSYQEPGKHMMQAGGEVFQFDECLRIVECGDGFLQIHIITFHQVTDYIGGYSFKEEFCGIRVHSRFSILIAASE